MGSSRLWVWKEIHRGVLCRERLPQNCGACITFLCSLQNEYMKDDFFIKIETWHKPDLGTLENVSFHSTLKGWGMAASWSAWSTCAEFWVWLSARSGLYQLCT